MRPTVGTICDRRWLPGVARRVLPTLAMLVAVGAFVAAGQWQRGRMEEREALGAQLDAAAAAAPVPLPRDVAEWAPWRFRTVAITGRYDGLRQVLIDNKVHAGRAGYHVVTPLVLADGRAVLVNRGFVAAGPSRALLPSVPPPPGDVHVRGRLNLPAAGYVQLASGDPSGPVWQNLDPARFAAATGLPVLPIVVEALEGPADGLVRSWPRPDLRTERNRIYMMQWYAFAALALALWAWFTFRPRPSR